MLYKKIVCALACLALVLSLAGCSGSNTSSHAKGTQKGVDAVLQEGIAKADAEAGEAQAADGAGKEDSVSVGPEAATGADEEDPVGVGPEAATGEEDPVGVGPEAAAGEEDPVGVGPEAAAGEEDPVGVGPEAATGEGEDGSFAEESDGRQAGPNENAPTPEAGAGDDAPLSLTDGVDVDLTTMNANMVYSEVYNMLCEPERYMGKIIRMEGLFSVFVDPTTNKSYYSCIIQDATACCASGLEFDPPAGLSYPDDYPAVGDDITVTGTFDTYFEGENEYCTLRNAYVGP